MVCGHRVLAFLRAHPLSLLRFAPSYGEAERLLVWLALRTQVEETVSVMMHAGVLWFGRKHSSAIQILVFTTRRYYIDMTHFHIT